PTDSIDADTINLTRFLSHLSETLLSPAADPSTLRSPYERNRIGANFESARSLLLRLEHDTQSIKIASKKQAVLLDLQSKRDTVRRLQARLNELNHEDSDEDDDDDDEEEGAELTPSEADTASTSWGPARTASASIDTEYAQPPGTAADAAAHLAGALRSRFPAPAAQTPPSDPEPSARTTGARYPGTAPPSNLESRDQALGAHRAEQEALTSSMLALAQQLKSSVHGFHDSVEAERDVLDAATAGLDRNVAGIDVAGRKMGALRRMTEGRGWWGRMLMYAWIAGLWALALVVVFVLPKLRF
ncbi:hypothetical protein EJ06DRAFT_450774, partial [Trichodelitschia bisporula]